MTSLHVYLFSFSFSVILFYCCILLQSDLMEKVVIPQLGHIENDPDPEVRRVAVEMLLGLAKDCNTAEFMDIIVLVEKASQAAFIL